MKLNSPEKLRLVLAAFWLQITVIAFVYVEVSRNVETPFYGWVSRIVHLFTM
jgi:hypothetical protein